MPAPKIAFFDIETAPSLGYYFDRYKEGNIISTKAPWYMLSFSVKWYGHKKPKTYCLCDYPRFTKNKEDDRDLVKDLWKVFNEADILIAHNGDRFDIRKANARFVVHGLKPPAPYKSIDTLKIARRHLKFDSNRLDAIGGYLRVGRKIPHTGVHLWLKCMAGDRRAWGLMRRYNAQDVDLLERVYLKLRAWSPTHPDITLLTGADGCPTCESHRVTGQGVKRMKTGVRQQFKCLDCGSWHSKPVRKHDSRIRR